MPDKFSSERVIEIGRAGYTQNSLLSVPWCFFQQRANSGVSLRDSLWLM